VRNSDNNNNNNNKLKYKSLCVEIQQMWNMKFIIISVVTGAIGIATKGLKKNLVAIPGKCLIHYKRQLHLEHHT
jgi:hypothetical protein